MKVDHVTVQRWVDKYSPELILEQEHSFIKKIAWPMPGLKSFASAEATLAGIELHHIIRNGQLKLEESTPFEQFYALAG